MMGSPPSEPCRQNEALHVVVLTRGFYMMQTEVTHQMWADLKAAYPELPDDPSEPLRNPTMDKPVNSCLWIEAVLFANIMSDYNGFPVCYFQDEAMTVPVTCDNYLDTDLVYCDFDVDGFRLPTEAEWEYACRAGSSGPFCCHEHNYNPITCDTCSQVLILRQYAYFQCTMPGAIGTCEVATLLPNNFGLHDMHGNIDEWVWDRFTPFPAVTAIDPTGPETGHYRILRGGSWLNYPYSVRSASRLIVDDEYQTGFGLHGGFRLVRTNP